LPATSILKSITPWYVKIPAKIVLSRLPVSHRAWRRLGIFRDGRMEDPAYGLEVFLRHFRRFAPPAGRGFTLLELGPGESVATGVIAHAYGAARTWLVDSVDHATRDPNDYDRLIGVLEERGHDLARLRGSPGFDKLCEAAGVEYLTGGLASLRSLPGASVDFIFSNAVLEHVPREEFRELLAQTRRILAPGGLCSHEVDLRDHLNDALNNLRFSAQVWESSLMSRSGFYTNRIRYREMIALFAAAGFRVDVEEELRWATLPTPRKRMSAEFRGVPEEDLRVSSFRVLLS
jgi:SAM-dependent methyltransferase